MSDCNTKYEKASSYIFLVAAFFGAVKGSLLLALVAVFSSSLFRFVMMFDFVEMVIFCWSRRWNL